MQQGIQTLQNSLEKNHHIDNCSHQQETKKNPLGGEESDSKSYHIRILKISSSEPKITKYTKKKENTVHSQEKKN